MDPAWVTLLAFLAGTGVVLLLAWALSGLNHRLEERVRGLAESEKAPAPRSGAMTEFTRTTLPALGSPLLPTTAEGRTRLRTRLIHAGLYSPQALPIFLGIKMLLMVAPSVLGLSAGLLGLVPIRQALFFGTLLGLLGVLGSSYLLEYRKQKRQVKLRRALPDALDVTVICVEGGLSLPAALQHVVTELRAAHPALAAEMNILQREIQLGLSTGEALRRFADRCDLDEMRNLSSAILQGERYGASLIKALRTHAEWLRFTRLQRAEELAQKAAVKIVFPTLLFIFPAIFLVLAGPAAIQIMNVLARMNRN